MSCLPQDCGDQSTPRHRSGEAASHQGAAGACHRRRRRYSRRRHRRGIIGDADAASFARRADCRPVAVADCSPHRARGGVYQFGRAPGGAARPDRAGHAGRAGLGGLRLRSGPEQADRLARAAVARPARVAAGEIRAAAGHRQLGGAYPTATAERRGPAAPRFDHRLRACSRRRRSRSPTASSSRPKIPYILLDDSIQQMPEMLREIGPILGAGDHGLAVASYAFHAIEALRGQLLISPATDRPLVYYGRGSDGLETGLPGSPADQRYRSGRRHQRRRRSRPRRAHTGHSRPDLCLEPADHRRPAAQLSTTRCCTTRPGAGLRRCAASASIWRRPTRLAGSTTRPGSTARSGSIGCRTCSIPTSIRRICAPMRANSISCITGSSSPTGSSRP